MNLTLPEVSTTADTVNITEALAELAQNNAEAADFVADYPNRQNYLGRSIDLASDVLIGQVPLLLQWDKRWGYESYGDSIIGLAGCGPTCLSMVYVYFTHDLNGTPERLPPTVKRTVIIRKMALAGPCGPKGFLPSACPARNFPWLKTA